LVLASVGTMLALAALVIATRHLGRGVRDGAKVVAGTGVGPAAFLANEGPGQLAGRVIDGQGRPVPGARVLATLQPLHGGLVGRAAEAQPTIEAPAATVSDAAGGFRFPALGPGRYLVTASARGRGTGRAAPVMLAPGLALDDVELRLIDSSARLAGRVRDASGGPVAGARVRAMRSDLPGGETVRVFFEDLSDPDGRYELSLEPGRHALTVEADGYAPVGELVMVSGHDGRDFYLQPAARLGGLVRGGDGEPVAEAQVRVEALDAGTLALAREVVTNQRGQFSVGGLMAGAYRVVARKDELVGTTALAVRLAVAATRDDLVVELLPGAAIVGRVKDTRGKPIANAAVWVVQGDLARGETPGQRRTRSGDDGRFQLRGLLAGGYRLRAEAQGMSSKEASVMVAGPKPVEVNLVLGDEATVTGQVTDEGGRPLANVLVKGRVRPSAGGPLLADQTRTDADGQYTLHGFAAGSLQLSARDEAGIVEGPQGTLAAGERRRIDLRLERGARLAGEVRFDDGPSAANVVVIAQSRSRGISVVLEARTDAGGAFDIGPLPAGDVSVHAVAADQRSSWLWPRDSQQVDLVLEKGARKTGVALRLTRRDQRLRGLVVGPDDQPIPDAVVRAERERDGMAIPDRGGPSAVTAADGTFTLEALAQGSYTLTAGHPAYAETSARGVSTAGGSVTRLRFTPAGTLAGVVVTAQGQPVTSYSLFVKGGGGPAPATVPGRASAPPPNEAMRVPEEIRSPSGAFAVGQLAPGNYSLLAVAPDGATAEVSGVALRPGEARRELRLQVTDGPTVSAEVRDFESGAAVAGAVAEVRLPGGMRLYAMADERGRISMANVPRVDGLRMLVRNAGETFAPESRPIANQEAAGVDLGIFQLVRERAASEVAAVAQVSFAAAGDRLVVARLAPGSTAASAGFRPGDTLVAVDGRDARGVGPNGITNLLGGPANSEVRFLVEAAGQPPREVRVPRTSMR
jgi:protocatechuate 3,4-dioxygenase beta subunit